MPWTLGALGSDTFAAASFFAFAAASARLRA
jgi:hypothetical protein